MNLSLTRTLIVCLIVAACGRFARANSPPEVSDVRASQRGDDSKLVDIFYNLADADGDPCTIWVAVSDNGGANFKVPVFSYTGDWGRGVPPGIDRHIVWDAGADLAGRQGEYKVRVFADDGKGPSAMVLVPAGWFAYQRVPPENWIFVDTFAIDKFEVTNQFYVQFLNNADPNGDHWTSEMEIDRHGEPGSYTYTIHDGLENHPIRFVNRYDAEAFAAWRGSVDGRSYRLPTEEEWEKAAAWDPVINRHWLYAFQQDSIDCPWCNYNNCIGRSTEVGRYNGSNGTNDAHSFYGCYDMSGNVWEWTSSMSGNNGVIRGGAWYSSASRCQTVYRVTDSPGYRNSNFGFRLVLDPN